LQVIAEGVESLAQRDMLANIDCDAFQGYYFAHPVAAADLPKITEEIGL
jgi:EAL domain-containing protein (putative c-di-GMP-specific phosphodiesterase class I)